MPTGAAANPNDEMAPHQTMRCAGALGTCDRGPFAWQDGRRLWILDGGTTDWVLAELLFEHRSCRYFEVRRSRYRWPREAAGALLGRTLAGGQRRAEDAARGLAEWVMRAELSQ